MPASITSHWQYIDCDCPILLDPRLAVCKQISWVSPGHSLTTYHGCEPDNYNSAIFGSKPYDLPWVKDQCFYYVDTNFKKQRIQGWISLYVVDELVKHEFNRAIIKIQPPAWIIHT